MQEDEIVSCESLRTVCILDDYAFYGCCCTGNTDISNISPVTRYKSYKIGDLRSRLYEFLDLKSSFLYRLQYDVNNPCKGCHRAETRTRKVWNSLSDKVIIKILAISFSWACNLRCAYFDVADSLYKAKTRKPNYEFPLAKFIEMVEREELIDLIAPIEFSSGELSIHPDRANILAVCNKYPLQIFSNCVRYDKSISDAVLANPSSFINVSIDSGTRETFHRVKGRDNFENVVCSLLRYSDDGVVIEPKYIMNSDNCDEKNISGFINICKRINTRIINISRDLYTAIVESDIVRGIAGIIRLAKENNIPYRILPWFDDDALDRINREIGD